MSDAAGVELPQPQDVSARERDDAMGAYLMMFAAWGVGLPLPVINMLAAVIYFFVNRRRSRFVAFHALQSLISQVPVTVVNVVAVVGVVRAVWSEHPLSSEFWGYLIFAAAVNLAYIAVSLVALGRARRGRFFYLWLVGRYAYTRYFGPDAVSFTPPEEPNRPPAGL